MREVVGSSPTATTILDSVKNLPLLSLFEMLASTADRRLFPDSCQEAIGSAARFQGAHWNCELATQSSEENSYACI